MTTRIEVRFLDRTITLPSDDDTDIARCRLMGVLARFPHATVKPERGAFGDVRMMTYTLIVQRPCPQNFP